MRIILVLLFCSVLMIGCSENLGEEFTIRGEITSIDPENKQIFIDGTPVIVKNIEDFKVGEILEAKLRSKSSNDYYNPKDIEIISLIKIE